MTSEPLGGMCFLALFVLASCISINQDGRKGSYHLFKDGKYIKTFEDEEGIKQVTWQ